MLTSQWRPSSAAQAAWLGSEDVQGGLGAAAADPHAGSGDEGAEVLAAAKGAGPAAALTPADATVPALYRRDPFGEFLLHVRGVDAQVVEDAAGGGAGV